MSPLLRYTNVLSIVGDILRVHVPEASHRGGTEARFGDLAVVEGEGDVRSLAQIIRIEREVVTLQVFAGTKGLSTRAWVRFLGHPMQAIYSQNILGRVFIPANAGATRSGAAAHLVARQPGGAEAAESQSAR